MVDMLFGNKDKENHRCVFRTDSPCGQRAFPIHKGHRMPWPLSKQLALIPCQEHRASEGRGGCCLRHSHSDAWADLQPAGIPLGAGIMDMGYFSWLYAGLGVEHALCMLGKHHTKSSYIPSSWVTYLKGRFSKCSLI